METPFAQADVIIVGGGMAGLTAALYLARAGMSVTVFEKAAHLGGRAATQDYAGYRFNRGAHAFYPGDASTRVLRELGIDFPYGSPTVLSMLQGGQYYPLPASLPALLRCSFLDLGDKIAFMRLFMTFSALKPDAHRYESAQQWLVRVARRPRVRQTLEAMAHTLVYSAALDLVSAEVLIKKLQLSAKHPVQYIAGGWQTLVDTLRSKSEKAGAHIVSGTRVEGLVIQEGCVEGVRLSDERVLTARSVLVATTPREAARLVDDPALQKTVNGLIPVEIACLDVALKRLPDPRHPVVQDLDQPRFLTAQSVYTQIAPQGGALIHTFKQLDPAHPSDPRDDERELEDLLDTVQPGWRDQLVKRIYLPRIDATGMLPTAQDGGYAGRPGVQLASVANLYLAGDWIGSDGYLLDASVSSARRAAMHIMEHHVSAMNQRRTLEPAR